ncbi:MAG TPA: PP2C family protein-serine/threonine phosphatase [Phycisphaerales bacterium]|nr:PP2C family protein-serine/threonine phosphatase [Phycisphaerales bacterium]
MGRHAVCFATSGNTAGARQRWVAPVEAAWPGEAPDFRAVGSDALVDMLEKNGNTAGFGCVLAVFGPSESARTIDRFFEALGAAHLPGICLVPDPAVWRSFQRHGIIFDSHDADPRALASMLYALCERQGAVDALAREVAIAQRCQGGIRSQMDRIHEELHLAAAVQREFTSAPLPRVDGLEFGVLFRPVNFVSGDIYNVRSLGDGMAAFFMADAVGHGVPAALLTMVLTSSLNTTEAGKVLEPAEVLRQLNERLCASCLGSGRFATALYGVVNGHTGEVRVAGAGHPWPVRVSRSGAMEVKTEGPLLGVFPGAEFTQARFELGEGDTLLLYTDGFEAMFPERDEEEVEWAGRTYLRELTRLIGGDRDLNQCVAELDGLLDEQSGSLHQADDITALVISARAAAAQKRLAA